MSANFPLRRAPLAALIGALLFVADAHPTDRKGNSPRGHAMSAPINSQLTVSNCNDSGDGSLRNAVANAVNGADISLQGLTCATITLTTGAIAVDVDRLNIYAWGNFPRAAADAGGSAADGYEPHVVTIDGGGVDRVFDHTGAGYVSLQGFALRNGYANGDGGCVRSAGSVNLIQTTVSGCRAHDADYHHGRGGGVFAANDFRATDSTVSGNRADGQAPHGAGVFAGHDASLNSAQVIGNEASGYEPSGGGMFAAHGLSVQRSTISGNHALADRTGGQGLAGGAYVRNVFNLYESTISANRADIVGGLFLADQDTVTHLASTIELSTISGNEGVRVGGALVSLAPLAVYNSTIAYNVAVTGGVGGIAIGANSLFVSSIIAGNSAGAAPSDIGLRNGAPSATAIGGNHDLVLASSIAVPADTIAQPPRLAPLADNGGPTQTHALLAGSPAIDHGSDPQNYVYDQRDTGYARMVGVSTDIGAYEFVPVPDRIFCDSFDGDDSDSCTVD